MSDKSQDESAEYEVEAILDSRGTGAKKQFLIHWKGYDDEGENTWEPSANLDPELVADYEAAAGAKQAKDANGDKEDGVDDLEEGDDDDSSEDGSNYSAEVKQRTTRGAKPKNAKYAESDDDDDDDESSGDDSEQPAEPKRRLASRASAQKAKRVRSQSVDKRQHVARGLADGGLEPRLLALTKAQLVDLLLGLVDAGALAADAVEGALDADPEP